VTTTDDAGDQSSTLHTYSDSEVAASADEPAEFIPVDQAPKASEFASRAAAARRASEDAERWDERQASTLGTSNSFATQSLPSAEATPAPAGVSTAGITGRVSIPTGIAASRVSVSAYNVDGSYTAGTASVDSAGRYTLANLPAGAYEVSASAVDDYSDGIYSELAFTTYWGGATHELAASTFDLASGQVLSNMDIVLARVLWIPVAVTNSSAATDVCIDAVAVDDSFSTSTCIGAAASYSGYTSYVAIPVPSGSYHIDAFEYRDTVDTDYAYWYSQAAFTSSKSAATPVTPLTIHQVRDSANVPYFTLNLTSMAGLGAGIVNSVWNATGSGLVAGTRSGLTIAFSGTNGIPGGFAELYDIFGYIGTVKLNASGVATFSFTPRAPELTYVVRYRGDAHYEYAKLSSTVQDAPSVYYVNPGFATQGDSVTLALHGVSLGGSSAVNVGTTTFSGPTVVDDYQLSAPLGTVNTPGVFQVGATVSGSAAHSYGGAQLHVLKPSQTAVLEGPKRVIDVRNVKVLHPYCWQVAGDSSVPLGAEAAIVNVTTSSPSGGGTVVLYPDSDGYYSAPAPSASSVNFETGRDVANSAIVALGENGALCAYVRGAPLGRLIVDVSGFIVPGSGITTQSAQRLLDTRYEGQVAGPIVGNSTHTIQVTGNAGVPVGATAILANVTVTKVKAPGHLKAWAADLDEPRASVLNYVPGQDKANAQIIGLSPDGTMSFKSVSSGTAQIIIDVVGYVGAVSDYYSVTPTRVIDTRSGGSHQGTIPGALKTGSIYSFAFDDTVLVPANADAVVLNVTVAGVSSIGHLTVYPDTDGNGATAPPNASNINYIPGRDIPNLVIVSLPANRRIDLSNVMAPSTNTANVVIDVVGYIAAQPSVP